jgi:hypothetical protein
MPLLLLYVSVNALKQFCDAWIVAMMSLFLVDASVLAVTLFLLALMQNPSWDAHLCLMSSPYSNSPLPL